MEFNHWPFELNVQTSYHVAQLRLVYKCNSTQTACSYLCTPFLEIATGIVSTWTVCHLKF